MKKTILYISLALVTFLYGQTQLNWNTQLRNRPNITRVGSLSTWTDNVTMTGTFLSKNIAANYLYCDQFTGADASIKTQNCIAALPVFPSSATSGQVSLAGFDTTSTQTWSTNPLKNLIGLNPSVLVWMGATSYQTNVQVKVPQGVQLKGFGRSVTNNVNIQAAAGSVWHANVSTISATSNLVSVTTTVALPSVELNDDIRISGVANSVFNSACTVSNVVSSSSFQCTIAGSGTVSSSGGVVDVPMIVLGDRSGAASSRLDGVNVDGANLATIGVYSDTINEQSGVFNSVISRFTTYSVLMEQSRNPASPQNYFLSGLEVYPTPGSTYGIWISKGGTLHGFDDVTVLNNTGAGANMTACVTIDGGAGTFISRLHTELCNDGLLLGPNSLAAGISVNGMTGPTNATVTNLVHLKAGCYSIDLTNIWGNGGTTNDVLGDDSDIGTLATNSQVSHFWVGPVTNGNRTVWTDFIGAPNHAIAGFYTLLSGFGSNGRVQWQETSNQCGAGAGGFDYLCADSTVHRFKFNNNNAGQDTVVGAATTDTFTNKTLNVPLTSGTGLQIFNTTTTCTTAGSVGATCTTAAISLPVAEADANYRLSCTGKGPTAVPVISSTSNSSASQFTITIAALTAVAASFSSYDCVAGHN